MSTFNIAPFGVKRFRRSLSLRKVYIRASFPRAASSAEVGGEPIEGVQYFRIHYTHTHNRIWTPFQTPSFSLTRPTALTFVSGFSFQALFINISSLGPSSLVIMLASILVHIRLPIMLALVDLVLHGVLRRREARAHPHVAVLCDAKRARATLDGLASLRWRKRAGSLRLIRLLAGRCTAALRFRADILDAVLDGVHIAVLGMLLRSIDMSVLAG